MRRLFLPLVIVAALAAAAPSADLSAKRKIELIQRDQVPRGATVVLRKDELNAYVRSELHSIAPDGVRDTRLELGNNRATGFALIDFVKLEQSQGQTPNWFIENLFSGEHPVRVDAQIRSGGGRAVVNIDRVEISGIVISGRALDYLIRNYLWQYYPDAKIGKPFELAHRIDRLDVEPSQVNVVIGK